MRIAVIAFGSRGDVQPYIAIARSLDRAGHDVHLVTHENFADLARAHGITITTVEGSVEQIVQSAEMRHLFENGNMMAITRKVGEAVKAYSGNWLRDTMRVCEDRELIVAGLGSVFMGLVIANRLNIPLLRAYLFPITPTREFPSVLMPSSTPRLGGIFNHYSHYLSQQMIWMQARDANRAGKEIYPDLPDVGFFGPYNEPRMKQHPLFYGFSPSVIPKPADWGEDVHITGYWFLDESSDWQPSRELQAFLDAGPPPVYIGFGSMGIKDPAATTQMVLEAVRKSGTRAVINSGWGRMGAETLPDNVFMIKSAPHAWLFPRMAAVIHHGGAGTTAAGLRAGVPSMITPFFGDQSFWGNRVAELGAGLPPITLKKLDSDRLASSLRDLTNDVRIQQRASRIGEQIRAENGIDELVAYVKTLEMQVLA